MKKIVCEMCESTNFLKEDGMFVCRDCGMRYSAEEAKKLMIEVEGDGGAHSAATAAPVDNELENLYTLARRAKENGNSEDAAKYYDMIQIKDPLSWEAAFYSVYYKAKACKIAQIESAGYSVANCLESTIDLINNQIKGIEEKRVAIKELTNSCVLISSMLFNGAQNHYSGIDFSIKGKYTQEMLDNCAAARHIDYHLGDCLEKLFSDDEAIMKTAATAWQYGISKHKQMIRYLQDKGGNNAAIERYAEKVAQYDEDYRKELEIESITAQIAALDNKIKVAEISEPSATPLLVSGLAVAVMGIIVKQAVILVFGAVLAIIGLVVKKTKVPSAEASEQQKETIENLKKEKEALWEKLNNL